MLTNLLPQSSIAVLHQLNPLFTSCVEQKRSVNVKSYKISEKKTSPRRTSLKTACDGHNGSTLLCPFILRLVKSDRDSKNISVPTPVDIQELSKNFTKRHQNRLQPLVLAPRPIAKVKSVEISVQKYKPKSSFRHWQNQLNKNPHRKSSTFHVSLKTMLSLADNNEDLRKPKQAKKNHFNFTMKSLSAWRETTLRKKGSPTSTSTSPESYAHNKSFFHDPNLSYDMLDND